MMPNVVRGDRMTGLLTYLVGPGRSNEHAEPHLVAGDAPMMSWFDDAELNGASAAQIARYLDQPRRTFGTEVNGGHVWHASLSLRAEEGQLTDAQWGAIATDFVSAMGFDDHDGTKAPCRWVAVRHGVSSNGNDHIHIAVNLVREDGTPIHNDYYRAQQAARGLEVSYALEELESVRQERATRGYDPAEREAQARARARARHDRERANSGEKLPPWEALAGDARRAKIAAELRTDQPRYLLSLRVRGAAIASHDEGEFVRRLRRSGVLVRPRFADGRTDVVTGYSVAERPSFGERPIWYGGGQLGRDLALPRLRAEWSDTPAGASAAAREWEAAYRGRRVVAPGREAKDIDPEMWDRQSSELTATVTRLREVPVEDRETWARVARQSAGVLAAWSNATEKTPGHLALASEALSRSAQTYRRPPRDLDVNRPAFAGTAMLVASATRGGQGIIAQQAMMRQMLRLAQTIHDANVAAGQAKLAARLFDDTRHRLVAVRKRLDARAFEVKWPFLQRNVTLPGRAFGPHTERDQRAFDIAENMRRMYPPPNPGKGPSSPPAVDRRHLNTQPDRDRGIGM
ncbi:relaxase/mobilization nuclease domain-containing protein [Pseudoclavibacter terrae]|uniref:relaxase/mobilization nuclease domain-containing protein n=1 Tax=Pseudoclavibacter terrae TaxID=1530195 RepID=UPI00232B864C|nr:relaxase/mobilization nuclease domain-containing protein [Pseudoclavibacter terrae]